MEIPIVKKKMEELNIELHSEKEDPNILKTIVFSRQIKALSGRLPKAQYSSIHQENIIPKTTLARSNTSDVLKKKPSIGGLEPVKEERYPSEQRPRYFH